MPCSWGDHTRRRQSLCQVPIRATGLRSPTCRPWLGPMSPPQHRSAGDHSRRPRHWRCGWKAASRPRVSAGEAAGRLETPADGCDAEWLLSFAASMQHKEPRAPRHHPSGAAAGRVPRRRSARLGLQLPPCPARARRAARLPEVEFRRGVSDLSRGAGLAGSGKRRQRGTRCGQEGPEMASAGGGDCEGAAPEADRPHQRPFLIGVSGGTASGKVRGRAARRGLPCRLDPGSLGLGAARSGLRPAEPRALGCEVSPPGAGPGGPGRLPLGLRRSLPARCPAPRGPQLPPPPHWVGAFRSRVRPGRSARERPVPAAGRWLRGTSFLCPSRPCVRRSWSCWGRTKWTTGSGSWSS